MATTKTGVLSQNMIVSEREPSGFFKIPEPNQFISTVVSQHKIQNWT